MSAPSAVRLFRLVMWPSQGTVAVVALVTVFSIWTSVNDPETSRQSLGVLLFLQMFIAATGFREHAARGRYDAALVAGASRVQAAWGHLLISIAPGGVSWLVVAAVTWAYRPGDWPEALTAGPLVAWCYVSAISWAVSLPTVAHASGAVWALVLVYWAGTGTLDLLRQHWLLASPGVTGVAGQLVAVAVCPFFLTAGPAERPAWALLLLGSAAACGVFGGVAFVARHECVLGESS